MRTKQKERSMAYGMKLLNKSHEKLLEVKEYSKLRISKLPARWVEFSNNPQKGATRES